MFLTPVVEHEIISIVKLCKPKNSKDCDDISMYLSLKLSSQLLSLLLTFLIYHSLVEFSQIT